MELTYLNLLDMARFMLGLIFAEAVFANHSLEKKSRFPLRFIGACMVLWLLTFTYFPISKLAVPAWIFSSVISAVWWLAASWLTLGLVLFCYDVSVGGGIFLVILGMVVQELVTVLIRYLWIGILAPFFPERHPGAYTLIMALIYTMVYLLLYFIFSGRIHIQEYEAVLNNRKILIGNIVIGLSFSVIQNLTSGLFAWVTMQEKPGTGGFLGDIVLPSYLTWMLAVLCIVMISFMYMLYEMIHLQQDRQMMRILMKEKEQQYQISRDNIDLINQKCHDLKHQLKALEMMDDAHRGAAFAETGRAIQIYDSGVKTGNEVLDTILMEKNLICAGHDINLSSNIKVSDIDFMDIIDIYTLLGNALDNAIEAVIQYEKAKRVISLNIREQGQMLNIFVDNYFDGKLKMKNGYPITGKEDKNYHGFGVKSIHMIAKKYKGDIRISQDGKTFSLQVMIPKGEYKTF